MSIRKLLLLGILLLPIPYYLFPLAAQDVASVDSVKPKKKSFVKRFIDEFQNVDTNYIEPNHFKFQVMVRNTNDFEYYHLIPKNSGTMSFYTPLKSSVGPYVGYSLIFLGYGLQLNNLNLSNLNKEFSLTLYTPIFGIDVFYRNFSEDFKIRSLSLGDGYSDEPLRGKRFDGFSEKQSGFNIYYIFNHHRHAYPAAYNQSTRQKRSSGSALVGFGYSVHTVGVDWKALDDVVKSVYPQWPESFAEYQLPDEIHYQCYNIYGGYSYNWVPLRNCLVGASLTAGIGYNRTFLENGDPKPFSFSNVTNHSFSLNSIGRLGITYWNDRWFAGACTVFHTYSFRADAFDTNDIFGNFYFYVGINFGKKKAYRKPGKFVEF